jgi:hypothetical protein
MGVAAVGIFLVSSTVGLPPRGPRHAEGAPGTDAGDRLDASVVRAALTPLQDILVAPGVSSAITPPARSPRIFGATLLPMIGPEQVMAVLLDPRALRAALPSLIRAEVVASSTAPAPAKSPSPSPGSVESVELRLLAWELEIPFFNLSGRAWIARRGDAVDFQLVDGAFSPGWIRFRATADPGTQGTVVTCESQLAFASTNWLIRRLARHDPYAETAMAAAIDWVSLRAVATRAGVDPGAPVQRPTGVPQAPATLRGDDLLAPGLEDLRARGTVLRVRRRENGRLAFASALASVARPETETRARLSAPESWTAFPGWRRVVRRAGDPTLFDVTDDIAFVDFDSTWRLGGLAPVSVSARAVAGSISGAILAWDFARGPASGPGPAAASAAGTTASTTVVLSMHPRLDAAGFIERRMVASEPLLEHAMALGLVYADVAGAASALASDASARPSR